MSDNWTKEELAAISAPGVTEADIDYLRRAKARAAEQKALLAQATKLADESKARTDSYNFTGLATLDKLKGTIITPASTIEKTKRAVNEQGIWQPLDIATNPKSALDKTLKSMPDMGSAAKNLENLANGNIKVGDISNIFNGKINDVTKQANAAIAQIGDLTGIGLFSGGGIGGVFNPAGISMSDASVDPSAATYVSLAKTVFTSGSSDAGETVDIYSATINSPQNKIKSVLSDVMDVVGSAIGGSLSKTLLDVAGKANILNNVVTEANAKNILNRFKGDILSGVPLTKDGLIKGLYESIGYDGKSLNFQGGLKGLGESMLSDITKQIDGQTGLITMYNGIKMVVDGDYDTAEGIFKILDNVTGNSVLSGFMDVTNTFKILNTVTKSLIGLGAPELFDKIVEKMDHEDRKKYIGDNIEEAILSGDLDFIEFAFKEVSGGWVLANFPNAVMSIVSNYKPNLAADDQISVNEYNRLISVLNTIDSDWDNVGFRSGVKVYDYQIFSQFNSQAKLAIISSNNREHITALIASEGFAETYDNLSELQLRYESYPLI